ncbi:MAG TPA: spermidine/putrescine ABC transporter substrate-binding protein [Ilumatobacteraceae bacterium]
MDNRFTRRQVIAGSSRLGLALAVGLPLLQACGDNTSSSGNKKTASIKDGLAPEAGPLRVFNYDSYVNPDLVKAFEKQYGVKVEITTFTTDDEAVTKIASGAVDVDLHQSASTTSLFKLVDTGLIQPLNKSYLTNIGNVAASLRDPYYDKGAKYTVPYTVFSTGIGFRADRVDAGSVSWETLWDPTYKGVTSLLDDPREGLSAAILRKGLTDVNTGDPAVIKKAGDDLGDLTTKMNIKVEIEGYHTIPEGSTTVAHTWSGDMLNAQYYLPDGTGPEVLAYWQPETAVISNDTMCVLTKAKNPVLAHLFINYLLDKANAQTNFGYVGYQPAIEGIGAQELIDAGLVPENLRSCVLTNDQISKGLRYLPLSTDVEALWNDAWSKFRAGA